MSYTRFMWLTLQEIVAVEGIGVLSTLYPSWSVEKKKKKKRKNYFSFATVIRTHARRGNIEHIVFLDWKCYSEIPVLGEFPTMEEHQILFVQIKIQLLYDCFSIPHRRTENEFFPRKRFHFARQFGKTEYRNVTRSPNSTENVVPFFRNTINLFDASNRFHYFSTDPKRKQR